MTGQKIRLTPDYRAARAKRYPALAEFADAIYWAERGDRSLLDAWLARCDAVKAAIPKPPPEPAPEPNDQQPRPERGF
ncbi:hypothetical protein ACUSIJ_07715 [Pseudochelatococcus sp. B33]